MPSLRKSHPPARQGGRAKSASGGGAPAAIAALRRMSSAKYRDGMARFAIPSEKAFGVPVGRIRHLGKRLGPDHRLAQGLWRSGWYEARMLAAFIDDPSLVTGVQMDRWCSDFDNWAVCDTVCFHLFDRVPSALAFKKIRQWGTAKPEFVRRAAFALLAGIAAHDKISPDEPFVRCLSLIERASDDHRNFVKKGVSWALRGIGHRSADLHTAAVVLARRLGASDNACRRWIGKDALRDLLRPFVLRKIEKKRLAAAK